LIYRTLGDFLICLNFKKVKLAEVERARSELQEKVIKLQPQIKDAVRDAEDAKAAKEEIAAQSKETERKVSLGNLFI
jgi:hypothetical protein